MIRAIPGQMRVILHSLRMQWAHCLHIKADFGQAAIFSTIQGGPPEVVIQNYNLAKQSKLPRCFFDV
jgi:hypothetical protein